METYWDDMVEAIENFDDADREDYCECEECDDERMYEAERKSIESDQRYMNRNWF